MSNATNWERVLAYCDEHGSITAREAFINLNINSPRKVISTLRSKGYKVREEPIPNNGKKPYHRYFIDGVTVDG